MFLLRENFLCVQFRIVQKGMFFSIECPDSKRSLDNHITGSSLSESISAPKQLETEAKTDSGTEMTVQVEFRYLGSIKLYKKSHLTSGEAKCCFLKFCSHEPKADNRLEIQEYPCFIDEVQRTKAIFRRLKILKAFENVSVGIGVTHLFIYGHIFSP